MCGAMVKKKSISSCRVSVNYKRLNEVGPIENRPSTMKLQHFVKKMPHSANNRPSFTCMNYNKKVNTVKNGQKQLNPSNLVKTVENAKIVRHNAENVRHGA